VAPYIYHGPLNLRIWVEKDPETQQVIAVKQYISTYEQTRTIWMDGRPHPSDYAPHTFMGFSTGTWDGQTLSVLTTHLKQGWLRRNGVPESDQATLIERFTRHGRNITHTVIITDPVYLSEPMIRTTDFVLNEQDGGNWLWPCEYVEEISGRAKGEVPHHLPGANPFLKEFADARRRRWAACAAGRDDLSRVRRAPQGRAAAETKADAPRVSQAKNPTPARCSCCRCRATSTCSPAPAATSSCRWARRARLLVDSKSAKQVARILAEVNKLNTSGKPVKYLLNTSADADHIGGNEEAAKALGSLANWTIINTPGATQNAVQIIAHDNVLARASGLPSTAQPTETFVGLEKEIYFNGEPVLMYHVPNAHTDGDSLVFFRKSDVVATGDIFRTDSYPVIDLQKGGSVQGVIDGSQPCARPGGAGAPRRGRHLHRPGPRPHLRRVRRAGVPRHGHDRPRPCAGDAGQGDVARAGEGGAPDARLRLSLRGGHRRVDHEMFVEAVYKSVVASR
jgi:hypothetical protein